MTLEERLNLIDRIADSTLATYMSVGASNLVLYKDITGVYFIKEYDFDLKPFVSVDNIYSVEKAVLLLEERRLFRRKELIENYIKNDKELNE